MRLLAALVVLLLGAAPVHAQSWIIQGADRYFHVEWTMSARGGAPLMDGYVHNRAGSAADHVRVLVESLDAGGAVTAQTIGYLPGVVVNNNRTYFSLRVPAAGNYRVRVASWDWVPSGPMQ